MSHSDDDLKKLAREIVDVWVDDPEEYQHWQADVVRALTTVRDEALAARLPSDTAADAAATYYEKFLSDTPVFENMRTRWMKFDFISGVNWLSERMKDGK